VSVDGFEDGLLFLGERHNAGELKDTLWITQVDFVHGAQFQQGAFGRELCLAQAVLEQGQEQVGQIADEDVSTDMLSEPMADGSQLGDAFQE
jgi:hypothetical protein